MSAHKAYDVVGIGVSAVDDMLYVDDYPGRNVKTQLIDTERHGGGPACTATATVGILRGRCSYVARLGNSDLAVYIESALKNCGVDTTYIVRDAEAEPYHSYIVADRSGNRNVFFDSSRFRAITAEDIPESLLLDAKVILLDHVADPALITVAEKIKRLQVPIIGDIEGRTESAIRIAELTDYLVVPEEFACWATGARDPQKACSDLARIQRVATIVTCGENGCYLHEAGNSCIVHIPAFEVEVFDTNGCGDTFHGAFALAIARGLGVKEGTTFASAAAALKANAKGSGKRGWNALPSLSEIIVLLESHVHIMGVRELLQNISCLQSEKRTETGSLKQ